MPQRKNMPQVFEVKAFSGSKNYIKESLDKIKFLGKKQTHVVGKTTIFQKRRTSWICWSLQVAPTCSTCYPSYTHEHGV